MDSSLAVMLAPLGCFSSGGRVGTLQRNTQGYINSAVYVPGLAERKAIVRRTFEFWKIDRQLRVVVGVHFHRTAHIREWHILKADQKSAKVYEFISNVRATAQGIMRVTGREGVQA